MTSYLVTGASRGIGYEFVRQLLSKSKASVVYAAVRNPDASEALKDLKKKYDKLVVIRLDVDDENSVRVAAEEVKRRTGTLDVLINCAGISRKGPVDELSMKDFEDVLRTNVLGPHVTTQAFLDLIKSSKEKKVINISSILGSIARNNGTTAAAYNVSKAALNQLTVQWAKENPDITFIPLHPGWVKTGMGGQNAPLEKEESVQGMLQVFESLKRSDSGRFLDFTGKELPW